MATPAAVPIGAAAWPLLSAAVLTLAALAYGHLVPFGQGPDEESHLLFVRTLAGGHPAAAGWAWGLPVFSTDPADLSFETHQPPLYYGLAAVAWKLGGLTAVRALSLLCAVLLVLVVWRLAVTVAGADLAAAAAAAVALAPMNGFLATRVNNDPMVNLLWAATLWRWAVTFRDGPSSREGLRVGLLIGAALLTKQNSLALLPLTVLAVALQPGGRRPEAARQAAITLCVAALLAGWWYLRNLMVYGDWFAQAAFNQRFVDRLTPVELARQFAHRPEWRYWPYVFQWVIRSATIYLGHGLFILPLDVYPVHLAVILAAGLAGAVAFGRRWRRGWDAATATGVLLAATAVVVTALLVRFNVDYFQAQGRYLFLAWPAWALLLAGGPSRVFAAGSAGRRYGLLVVPVWLGLVNTLLLTAFIPGLFDAS